MCRHERNALTSVAFNESDVLRAIEPSGSASSGVVRLFYNDEHALTLGVRSGSVLLILLVVPLCIPALIFGSGAVVALDFGLSARGHFSLLAALRAAPSLCAHGGKHSAAAARPPHARRVNRAGEPGPLWPGPATASSPAPDDSDRACPAYTAMMASAAYGRAAGDGLPRYSQNPRHPRTIG